MEYLIGHGKAPLTQAESDHLADLLAKDSKNVKQRLEIYVLTLIGGVVNNERCRLTAWLQNKAELEFTSLLELVTIKEEIHSTTYMGKGLGETTPKHPGLVQKNRVRNDEIESAYFLK